jgi:hypothetical protein
MTSTKPFIVRSALSLFGGVCVLMACVRPVDAQRPERPQEVRVPGIDVALKPGWQLLMLGGCRFAVPPRWEATRDGSTTFSPDGNSLAVQMLNITNWSAHKAQIKALFGRLTVLHEDSDRRLWLEFDDDQRIEHYVDVVNGQTACTGFLDIRTASRLSVDDVNRIAESIGPAPAHWPPGQQ